MIRLSSGRRDGGRPLLLGIVGTVAIIAIMAVAYRFDQLPFIEHRESMSAEFAEVGGLTPGDDVIVSGFAVGEVTDMRIQDGHALVEFDLKDAHVDLGDKTEARVVTLTLLGEAALELAPAGREPLDRSVAIPVARTSSPYDITNALSQLTTEVSEIDTDQLTEAVDHISETFESTPEDLKGTLRGVTEISETVSANDEALLQLLERSRDVSGVLADRNEQVATLLESGSSLLTQLNQRQDVIVSLLEDAERLAAQVSALVDENRKELKPALAELNDAIELLNDNRDNLQATIRGVTSYATELGEAVSSGPFFDAYIQNLTSPQTLLPIISGALE